MVQNFKQLCFSVVVLSFLIADFEGRMWDLIVSVPDHCLSFYLDWQRIFLQVRINFIYVCMEKYISLRQSCGELFRNIAGT